MLLFAIPECILPAAATKKVLSRVGLRLMVYVLALLGTVSRLAGQDLPWQQVLRVQDERDADGLGRFLQDPLWELRSRATLAAGSVQDSVLIPGIIPLLADSFAAVRKAAAFSLGQMHPVVVSSDRRKISSSLLSRLQIEKDIDVVFRIVEALGKTGDSLSLHRLVTMGVPELSGVHSEIALSIGRYAYRGIKSREATSFVMQVLERTGGVQRWKPAYALMRIADRLLLEEHVDRISAAAQSADSIVQMFIASSLSQLTSKRVVLLTLLSLAESGSDWRVRVNAVKALSNVDASIHPDVVLSILRSVEDSSQHVAIQGLTSLRSIQLPSPAIASSVHTSLMTVITGRKYSDHIRAEAAITLGLLRKKEALGDIRNSFSKGRLGVESYAKALQGIGDDESRLELLTLARGGSPRLLRIVLESLLISSRVSRPDEPLRQRIRDVALEGLSSRDIAVLTKAAEILEDSLFFEDANAVEVVLALQSLRSPGDVEPMVALIRVLGKMRARTSIPTLMALIEDIDMQVAQEAARALASITGLMHRRKGLHHSGLLHKNHDWDLLARIKEAPDVLVKTSRGSFVITMLPEDAPLTCVSFATLIRKGFFDGLTFHRVVPNFVVQGGDPRGDGWGGPGFSIRSEFGYASYERGVVGVASSGKDTEGSQFFVTHSRQPHLDGRYTIFGRVTSGMGVVELLQIGDRIERMVFSADPGNR